MATKDMHVTIEELLEALFFVWSVLRLHNESQLLLEESLEMEVKGAGGCCEMAASLGVSGVEWSELVGE
jgi:hypothetical protein